MASDKIAAKDQLNNRIDSITGVTNDGLKATSTISSTYDKAVDDIAVKVYEETGSSLQTSKSVA